MINSARKLDGPVVIPHLYNGKDKTFFLLQWEQSYENLPNTAPTISSIPNPHGSPETFPAPVLRLSHPDIDATDISTIHSLHWSHPWIVDGKTKKQYSPFPGNIIPTTCTPIAPATSCSAINPIGKALAQLYSGITPNYNPGAGYAPCQNNLYWHSGCKTDIIANGTIKIDQNFGRE